MNLEDKNRAIALGAKRFEISEKYFPKETLFCINAFPELVINGVKTDPYNLLEHDCYYKISSEQYLLKAPNPINLPLGYNHSVGLLLSSPKAEPNSKPIGIFEGLEGFFPKNFMKVGSFNESNIFVAATEIERIEACFLDPIFKKPSPTNLFDHIGIYNFWAKEEYLEK